MRTALPEPGRPFALIAPTGERGVMDLDLDIIIALFKAHGALLLRGFGADMAAFGAFAAQLCSGSVFNESPGRRALDAGANIHSVNTGTEAFPLHPELSREPWKPDVAFFCCFDAPARGGSTTICDGVELVSRLPSEARAALAGRRLVYVQPTWPGLFDYWLGTATPSAAQLAAPPATCPYSFMALDGGIARVFSRPALHRPMFIDAPAFGNFLLFSRFHNNVANFPVFDDGRPVPEPLLQAAKAAGDALTAPVEWRRGDLLMLDNSRFMHGRTAILDTGQRLIASFFGYLAFAPRDPEEPPDPVWRAGVFRPPLPPGLA